jgi:hypothetical protein
LSARVTRATSPSMTFNARFHLMWRVSHVVMTRLVSRGAASPSTAPMFALSPVRMTEAVMTDFPA